MGASIDFKRLFVRGLLWDSQQQSISLAAALKAASQAKLTDSSKGKVLMGTTSGGTGVQFGLPPVGDLSANDIASVCSEILDLLDIIEESGNTYTDEEKTALLLRALKSRKTEQTNFQGLRL